nr:hypothetical protein [Tanacetum cinerariifolium]
MRNRFNLHTIRDESLLGTLKFVSKTQDYQQCGAINPDVMINQAIKDSKASKNYYDFATRKATPKKAMKYKKVASPSRKLSPVLEEEPAEKPKRAKKPSKKSTTVSTAGVVIRDNPSVSVSKKKGPPKGNRGKDMELLSDVALLKVAQVKEALQKSKKDSHMLHASGSGVLDVPKYISESENESLGDSDDDESNDDDSDEVTKDDDEDDVKKHDDDSFEFNNNDEEYDELYKDVNMRSKVAEHKEVRKGDAEMTDTTHESASQEKSYEQVIKDAHVTLTSSQKNEAEFEKKAQAEKKKYINIIEKLVKEIIKDKEAKSGRARIEEVVGSVVGVLTFIKEATSSTIGETLSKLRNLLAKSDETEELCFEPSFFCEEQSTYEAAASLTEFELKKILLDKFEKSKSCRAAEQHKNLYNALVRSYQLDTDLFDSYGKAYSLKRGREDKDKDKDPPAGSDQGLKKRKPLPLIEDQGLQVVPANYFFNNDLKYLKGGSLSSKYTSTTKTKAAKYDTIKGIEDMVT